MNKLMNKPATMLTLFRDRVQTPTGPMWLVTDTQARVRALDWEEQRMHRLLSRQSASPGQLRDARAPQRIRDALDAYFAGDLTALNAIATANIGTAFQQTVWRTLRTIEAGSTRSYGDIATSIENPKAVRAVGLANGQNPIGIIVPCHRVIGKGGALTGYGGGIERKRWLLQHEGALA